MATETGIDKERIKKHEHMLDLAANGRSALAAAFLEDEAVRLTAQENARDYVLQCEAEKNETKPWVWNVLFFLLGMLFTMSIDPLTRMIWDLIKIYNGEMP
jgi:hypothetical protein